MSTSPRRDERRSPSAINEIPGTVKEIISDKVLSEIIAVGRRIRPTVRSVLTLKRNAPKLEQTVRVAGILSQSEQGLSFVAQEIGVQ